MVVVQGRARGTPLLILSLQTRLQKELLCYTEGGRPVT